MGLCSASIAKYPVDMNNPVLPIPISNRHTNRRLSCRPNQLLGQLRVHHSCTRILAGATKGSLLSNLSIGWGLLLHQELFFSSLMPLWGHRCQISAQVGACCSPDSKMIVTE